MDRKELKEYLIKNNYPSGRVLKVGSAIHGNFVASLIKETKFLDEVYNNVPMATRCICILEEIYDIPKCKVCGGKVRIGYNHQKDVPYSKSKFREYCSKSCLGKGTQHKKEETHRRKHGGTHQMHNPDVIDKIRKTTLENHGVEFYFQAEGFYDKHIGPELAKVRQETLQENLSKLHGEGITNVFQLEEVKEKIKSTNLERHGVENYRQTEECNEKIIKTNLERYGVEYYTQSEEYIINLKKETLEKHGVEFPNQKHFSKDYIELISDAEALEKEYKELGSSHAIAKKYNIGSQRTVLLSLHRLGIKVNDASKTSSQELKVRNFLDSLGVDYTHSDRTLIAPKEIDIVVENSKLAIEINGSYYHSDIFKDKKYHQDKSLEIAKLGYRPFHIHQHDIDDDVRFELIKKKLIHLLELEENRVYARKCKIVTLTSSELKDFYNETHIQGHIGAKINYALVYDDEIVSAISFKKIGENEYDLVRYSSSCSVIGGFTKLLSHFKRQHKDFISIITYANMDYSVGELYLNNNFEFLGYTPPNYFYVRDGKRYSRQQFMKHKLKDRLEIYDENMTEKELMNLNNYFRIYDSGSMKFIMYNK